MENENEVYDKYLLMELELPIKHILVARIKSDKCVVYGDKARVISNTLGFKLDTTYIRCKVVFSSNSLPYMIEGTLIKDHPITVYSHNYYEA